MTDQFQDGKLEPDDQRAMVNKLRSENRQIKKLVEDLLAIQEREVKVRQRLLDQMGVLGGRLKSQASAQLSGDQVTALVRTEVRDQVAHALSEAQSEQVRQRTTVRTWPRVWVLASCIALVSFIATIGFLAAPIPSLTDFKQRFLVGENTE